jgi:hypothetical protein
LLVFIYKRIQMSKKFIITEEERNEIKSLYKINEGAGDIIPALLSSIFSSEDESEDSSDSDVSSLPDKTTSDDDFYKSVLKCLGAKPTKSNMLFMYAWRQAEGGGAKNNPFNTTQKMEGATNYNKIGVKNYRTSEDGIQATCKTLINGRDKYGYGKIIDGLKNDVGLSKLSDAVVSSKWGTKDLLTRITKDYLAGVSPKPKDIA